MAERSPFPARTPITTTDGRASLSFSRWLLNEFGALSEIRTTAVTSGATLPLAAYPQALSSVAIPAASYASPAASLVLASYAGASPLPVASASYPGEGSIPLPFGDY